MHRKLIGVFFPTALSILLSDFNKDDNLEISIRTNISSSTKKTHLLVKYVRVDYLTKSARSYNLSQNLAFDHISWYSSTLPEYDSRRVLM